ncbi:unnamed protein product [Acanthosepion pharaonis]|uniref:Uncharacterized protein n=1 Tax=Acanthosepion pharaonis TaxID=158019 RepID=A0A812DUX9_ACAPH|nr:unnamed protein product [Sepia pharaonis]
MCRQGSLLGDQTPFFLLLFSYRLPGYYAFLLRLLEGENLLKHAMKHFLRTHVFPSSSQTALAPNFTYGLLFKLSFLGLLRQNFSKLSQKGKLALSNFVTHASLLMGKRCLPFQQGERKLTSSFQAVLVRTAAMVQSQFSFPFQRGGGRCNKILTLCKVDIRQMQQDTDTVQVLTLIFVRLIFYLHILPLSGAMKLFWGLLVLGCLPFGIVLAKTLYSCPKCIIFREYIFLPKMYQMIKK